MKQMFQVLHKEHKMAVATTSTNLELQPTSSQNGDEDAALTTKLETVKEIK